MNQHPQQQNEQKQSSDRDRAAENVKKDGFTAEEIGKASIYDSESEIAQQMRRGDESGGDDQDVVGVEPPEEFSEDVSADKKNVLGMGN